MNNVISKDTLMLLEDIEERIDPKTEEDFVDQWRDFLFNRFEGDIFAPVRKKLTPSTLCYESIDNINDAVSNYDHMLRQQLQGVSASLNNTGRSLCLRANYGTGIMTSLFGAEIFHMPREANTLPTTRSFNDTEIIRKVVEKGIPDLYNGFGKSVFEFGEICAELFQKYPKIQKYVTMYHPDLQGPLDVCELLWGSEMFYAMYDEPELVHDMLTLITDTYEAFIEKWFKLFPASEDINPHWENLYHRGKLMLRNDSAMNLSPELYREFSVPYDSRLLNKYGGAVHFCGRGDHYIEILSKIRGLYGVNMSQPHLNDMEVIYKNTVDKGIKLLNFNKKVALESIDREGCFHHNINAR